MGQSQLQLGIYITAFVFLYGQTDRQDIIEVIYEFILFGQIKKPTNIQIEFYEIQLN